MTIGRKKATSPIERDCRSSSPWRSKLQVFSSRLTSLTKNPLLNRRALWRVSPTTRNICKTWVLLYSKWTSRMSQLGVRLIWRMASSKRLALPSSLVLREVVVPMKQSRMLWLRASTSRRTTSSRTVPISWAQFWGARRTTSQKWGRWSPLSRKNGYREKLRTL